MDPLTALLGVGLLYLLFGKKEDEQSSETFTPPGGGSNLPPPPFIPAPSISTTPISLTEQQRATELAGPVAEDIAKNGMRYDRVRLGEFQRLARIAGQEGARKAYGPKTAGALGYFLHRDPPAPLYGAVYPDLPGRDPKAIVPYSPPKG